MPSVPTVRIDRSLLRSLRAFSEGRLRYLDDAAALGPVAGLRFGRLKVHVVTDPELARRLLVTDAALWTRPPAMRLPVRMGVGENIFTQSDKACAVTQPFVAARAAWAGAREPAGTTRRDRRRRTRRNLRDLARRERGRQLRAPTQGRAPRPLRPDGRPVDLKACRCGGTHAEGQRDWCPTPTGVRSLQPSCRCRRREVGSTLAVHRVERSRGARACDRLPRRPPVATDERQTRTPAMTPPNAGVSPTTRSAQCSLGRDCSMVPSTSPRSAILGRRNSTPCLWSKLSPRTSWCTHGTSRAPSVKTTDSIPNSASDTSHGCLTIPRLWSAPACSTQSST